MDPTSVIAQPDPRADLAFRALEGALTRRRWQALEPVLRLELGLVALLLAGFLFLQLRGPFETLQGRFGPTALAAVIAALGIALAAGGAALVARRHARRLRRPDGPAWFALPLAAATIERHLARASSLHVAWVALPMLLVVIAAIGLVPAPVLVALLAVDAALLVAAARVGCALARRRVGGPASQAEAPALRRMPPARHRRVAPWIALVAKDALAVTRRPELLQGAIGVALFGALSLLGWLLPTAPPPPGAGATPEPATAFDLRHLATFFVTLLAAASLAEWMVVLVGSDPFAAFRVLPLGVSAVWRARAAWALALATTLVTGHALLAHGLPLAPRLLFLMWVGVTTFGIAILGVHFALTLYPRMGPARPLLALTFGVMAIASVAVFLSGWVVLLVALVVTARRLPRWEHATEGDR